MDEHLLGYNFENYYYLSYDFETNGLHTRYNLPWEIAFNVYKGSKLIEKHCLWIKWPNYKIPEKLVQKLGFNLDNLYSRAKEPKEVLDFVDSYLYNEKYKLVGSNILKFDILIHQSFREECGKNIDYSYLSRAYDTDCLAKAYLKQIPVDNDDFLGWQFRLTHLIEKGLKSGIKAMSTKLDIPYDDSRHHDASWDTNQSFEIFKRLVKKLEIKV